MTASKCGGRVSAKCAAAAYEESLTLVHAQRRRLPRCFFFSAAIEHILRESSIFARFSPAIIIISVRQTLTLRHFDERTWLPLSDVFRQLRCLRWLALTLSLTLYVFRARCFIAIRFHRRRR